MKTSHAGSCPVCKQDYCEKNWRTRHHILPKRFFHGVGGLYILCRKCHNKLELLIPVKRRLEEYEYREILFLFIKNEKAAS
jgi:hypothetical protein